MTSKFWYLINFSLITFQFNFSFYCFYAFQSECLAKCIDHVKPRAWCGMMELSEEMVDKLIEKERGGDLLGKRPVHLQQFMEKRHFRLFFHEVTPSPLA